MDNFKQRTIGFMPWLDKLLQDPGGEMLAANAVPHSKT
jgi:hypothetical protein